MRNIQIIAVFILSIVFLSCSDRERKETNQNKPEADSKSLVEKSEFTQKQDGKEITKKETGIRITVAAFDEKIENGEILLLTDKGEPRPYEFIGSKIMTMQMPDGKFHQVEIKNDRAWINVPGKGEMQAIRLNGKVYLFDDDNQAYEVKIINNELAAQTTSLTDELIAMDKSK
jgi:hypothetical protein